MTLSRPGLALLALLAAAPAALAAEDDLAWIATIPGLTAQVERGGPTGEAIYTVAGDPGPVFEKLHAGFVKDGWTIEKFRNTGLAGVSLRTLVAVKAGTRVKLLMNAGAESSQILLNRRPADEPVTETEAAVRTGAAAVAAATAAAAAVGDVVKVNPAPAGETSTGPAMSVGARHELLVDRTRATLSCIDTEVVVMANRNDLALEGRCRHLLVNGTRNKVRVLGSVEAITVNGNYNTITWSAAGSPKTPRVIDLGSHNKVNRVE